jgi:pentatricopeptide repeat protein
MEPDYRVVYVASGNLDAEEIRIFLESAGIRAYINQESVGITGYSLAVGSIGQAMVYVSAGQYEEARQLLEKMKHGDLETNEDLSHGETVEDDEEDEDFDEA